MDAFTTLKGIIAPLDRVNVDTDQIIPKQYLKTIKRTGMREGLFSDWRYTNDGNPQDGFVLNQRRYEGASILMARDNFGCGSSREHAPQALKRWGIGACIGESFSEIFLGNATTIGLACATASASDVEFLMTVVEDMPATTMVFSVDSTSISAGDRAIALNISSAVRRSLLTGQWDATGLLLERFDDVRNVASDIPYVKGF